MKSLELSGSRMSRLSLLFLVGFLVAACGSSSSTTTTDEPVETEPEVVEVALDDVLPIPTDAAVGTVEADGEDLLLTTVSEGTVWPIVRVTPEMRQAECWQEDSSMGGAWWVFRGEPDVALELGIVPVVWTWDPERVCLVAYVFPEAVDFSGTELHSMEMLISVAYGLATLPDELPMTAMLELLDSYPGEEHLLLGEHGFRIATEEGEEIDRFIVEGQEELTLGLGHYEGSSDPTAVIMTAGLIAQRDDDGRLVFTYSVQEVVEGEDQNSDSAKSYLVEWDDETGSLVPISLFGAVQNGGTMGATEISETRDAQRFYFPSGAGVMAFERREEGYAEMYDCTTAGAFWEEGAEVDETCCFVTSSRETTAMEWFFYPYRGPEIYLAELSTETESTVDPPECE